MTMAFNDAVGFLAAGTMIIAFCSRRMIPLRIAAIMANLLFIAYALRLDLMPVLALHCILLPLNILRLATALSSIEPRPAAPPLALDRQQALDAFLQDRIKARRLP